MAMLCPDCNQLKHPGTECQLYEEVPATKFVEILRYFKNPHVCAACGSTEWRANLFYVNREDEWHQDEPAFWCGDCDASVDITPLKE